MSLTWTSRNSAADNSWTSITYGNGLFVAVSSTGTGNRVMTSPDGITWTPRTSATDISWASITYGNGLFVAVSSTGAGNRVMTSPDGITWTSRNSAAINKWTSITYGNGLFVAVSSTGANNRVMTSPDGITWTSRNSAADNNWTSITYGNGLFVAVSSTGTGNRVMTSPDGITWTPRTSATDISWASITYGNGLFVAVSSTVTGNRVMTSPDGITWTPITSATDNSWLGVTYGNGLFVAVSSTGTGNRVMTSPSSQTITNPTISDFSIPTKTYGDAPFEITPPTSDSSGSFTYISSNTSAATISGTTITIVGAGSSTITATQAQTTNYTSGTITTSFLVNQETPTISYFSIPTKTYGDAPFEITQPTSDSSGSFTYTSSNTSVATISGTTITIVGAGSSTITATQAQTTNYTSGTITTQFQVNQETPTIINFSIPTKTYGDAPFEITPPTSDSSGSFTYISSNTSAATISGTTITIVGAGSSTITATQAQTTNYTSGTITTSFLVNQETPTIINFSIPTKTYGDAPFEITQPTSDSSGSFTYTSSNTSVATISGTTITIVGFGTSVITATQAQTTNYTSGTITTPFLVSPPTITGVVMGSTNLSIVITGTFFLNVNSILINGYIYPSSVIINSDNSITATLFKLIEIKSVQVTNSYSSSNLFNVNPPIYPTCFPSGTPILTDQGIVAIEKINKKIHTINNKKIIAITQTITNEEHLVCIEKNALGLNIPSEKTIISRCHGVLYNDKMVQSRYLKNMVKNKKSIYNIKYNGEILYNILMENHDTMSVNNMTVETLDPKNIIAKLYSGKYNEIQKNNLIIEINECMKKKDFKKK